MKIDYPLPKKYKKERPAFYDNGKPTIRVRNGLENVLHAYSSIAVENSKHTDNNPQNYKVTEVYVVGSCARANRVDSDLDLLLIAPDLDENSAKHMKSVLSMIFFNDKKKWEAVDVFVRKEDIFPDRESINITEKVRNIVEQYNSVLDFSS